MAFFPLGGEDVTPQSRGVPFTAHTIETEDGERLRAWHLARPDARAQVVYFHGNGGNLSLWSDIVTGLWSHGLDVIAVDYRGYGVSSGSPSEAGLYRDAAATVGFSRQHLRRPGLPLIYWGRSIGTAVAASAANRQPPDGIILEAGFPSARALFDRNPVLQMLSLLGSYRFDVAKWMAPVTAPVLVIHGDRDRVIPYRHGQRLHEQLSGPKRFITIAGGDHNDAEPADPEAYWRAVGEFVASLRDERG